MTDCIVNPNPDPNEKRLRKKARIKSDGFSAGNRRAASTARGFNPRPVLGKRAQSRTEYATGAVGIYRNECRIFRTDPDGRTAFLFRAACRKLRVRAIRLDDIGHWRAVGPLAGLDALRMHPSVIECRLDASARTTQTAMTQWTGGGSGVDADPRRHMPQPRESRRVRRVDPRAVELAVPCPVDGSAMPAAPAIVTLVPSGGPPPSAPMMGRALTVRGWLGSLRAETGRAECPDPRPMDPPGSIDLPIRVRRLLRAGYPIGPAPIAVPMTTPDPHARIDAAWTRAELTPPPVAGPLFGIY